MANLRLPIRDYAIQQSITALRDGVPVRVIALRLGVSPRTLHSWLERHPEAYKARLHAIANMRLAHDETGKRTAFWQEMRLRRLSLYREQHGINLRPARRKNQLLTPTAAR